jgi:hypothetical protein
MQWELFARAVEKVKENERKPTEGNDRLPSEAACETFGRHIPNI